MEHLSIFYTIFSYLCYFRQSDGENKSSIGKSSKRPASMSKVKTILETSGNEPKLLTGPTTSKPGPILFKQEAIAEKHF